MFRHIIEFVCSIYTSVLCVFFFPCSVQFHLFNAIFVVQRKNKSVHTHSKASAVGLMVSNAAWWQMLGSWTGLMFPSQMKGHSGWSEPK